ncbi:hypothetical protein SAY86_011957 [Trapa natans]|uniref:RING-type domain-containing protein n=1 Tax=Trapa natans TaxID=22666 RepID=A0AAN7LRE5_TRANT|nr:hypothetical protein SAY86_011957 [Trapa natans]
MAVEAQHLNIFPPQQLLANREMATTVEAKAKAITNPYNYPYLSGGYRYPRSETTTADTMTPLPMYNSPAVDYLPPKTPVRSDSGLTHNINNISLITSRKRSRDATNQNNILPYAVLPSPQLRDHNNCCTNLSFLGEDISHQIERQQLDVNRFIAHHMEKARLEIEERMKSRERMVFHIVGERIAKRLRTKEEEIDKIVRLNWALQEKIKSLCMENQIWRDLAQNNEATANALRTNLEQVLAHVDKDDGVIAGGHAGGLGDGGAAIDNRHRHPLSDDTESCCDSSSPGDDRATAGAAASASAHEVGNDMRLCRSCQREEARVLLLPCRHLCLCTVCGSSMHTCPVCNTAKTVSVHINVS